MDQRDSHCPYSLSSEITAKPTVLGLLVYIMSQEIIIYYIFDTHKSTEYILFIHFICVVQQRGKKTLLSLTLICYCHLVGMAKIVRGSTLYDHETPLLADLADLLYIKYGIALFCFKNDYVLCLALQALASLFFVRV